jgi:hypothetical protein
MFCKARLVTWIGPSGFYPKIGVVKQGDVLEVSIEDFKCFLEQKLVKLCFPLDED